MKYKGFLLACSIMLMFALNNCVFLKNYPEEENGSNTCAEDHHGGLIFGLTDFDKELVKLSLKEKEQHDSIDNLQAKETANMIKSIHNKDEVKNQNLLQFYGSDAINDFGKFLNLKVGPPTISNSISNTQSIAKGKADDNSVVNTVQNVKSTTNADAEGEKNSIAVSNVVGNTDAKSNNLAVDNSRAVNVIDNQNNGNATATASENSLAASSVKADHKSDTNTAAIDKSTAIGGTQMTTNADSTATAVEGSVADNKAITNEKSVIDTAACNNSTAIGVTAVNTDVTSTADAANQSLAQSVGDSQNTANTKTVAKDDSAAVGASLVNSTTNSTALATDGGNALSVAESKSCVGTDSVANNSSASVVTNTGGSNSNATSVSNGTAAPYVNPLETPATSASKTEEAPISLTPSSTPLQATRPIDDQAPAKMPLICDEIPNTLAPETQAAGTQDIMDKVRDQAENVGPSEVAKETILKAASDLSGSVAQEKTADVKADRNQKTTCRTEDRPADLKSERGTKNLTSETLAQKETSSTAAKESGATSCDATMPEKTTSKSIENEKLKKENKQLRKEQEEAKITSEEMERKKIEDDREKLRAERERLREENRRLRDQREEAEAKAKALSKAEERRKRKERKEKERRRRKAAKRRNDREMDMADMDMCAPNLQATPDIVTVDMPETARGKYDEDCEMNKNIARDFEEGIKESNLQNDPKFSDAEIFKDDITEFDMRTNDAKVLSNCQDICKTEKLGNFVESEIQDLMVGKFLFKCRCSNGITDWFLFNEKTKKSKAFGSSTQNLLDEVEPEQEEAACQAPALQAAPAVQTQQAQAPQAAAKTTSNEESDDDDSDDESIGGAPSNLGDCFNFFIENKFKKLHNRLNKLKARNTNYVSDIHQRQLEKKSGKAQEMVDNAADRLSGTGAGAGSACENAGSGADRLSSMKSNMSDMKSQMDVKKCAKDTPEDVYFKNRNAKDEDKFNQRINSRFDEKKKSEENRFTKRFQNVNRYAARDRDQTTEKKPAVRAADSKAYICDEVGKIKAQNQNYLSRIKSMFGGTETKIDSE